MVAWLEAYRLQVGPDSIVHEPFATKHNAQLDRIIARLTASDEGGEPVAWAVVDVEHPAVLREMWTEKWIAENHASFLHAQTDQEFNVVPLFTHPSPAASEKGREVTEEQVEAVARRIYEIAGSEPEGFPPDWRWDQRDDAFRAYYRKHAREALTAAFSAPDGGDK